MSIDWNEVSRAISPIKDYADLCRRTQASFAYPFVGDTYNYSLPELIDYTQRLLGGDSRGRYEEYAIGLVGTLTELHHAGVPNVQDLLIRTGARDRLENFAGQSQGKVTKIVTVLKYLVYWFIPMQKYLSGLVRDDPITSDAIRAFRESGVRTNLDLLQRGIAAADRRALARTTGLPEPLISEWVNRADFSRLPWASKATISNIIGAGYSSLARLANADPQRLYADFFGYGKSIGKNLKLGNEIENSYRIAKIMTPLLRE